MHIYALIVALAYLAAVSFCILMHVTRVSAAAAAEQVTRFMLSLLSSGKNVTSLRDSTDGETAAPQRSVTPPSWGPRALVLSLLGTAVGTGAAIANFYICRENFIVLYGYSEGAATTLAA